jgi:hypothetical protein
MPTFDGEPEACWGVVAHLCGDARMISDLVWLVLLVGGGVWIVRHRDTFLTHEDDDLESVDDHERTMRALGGDG